MTNWAIKLLVGIFLLSFSWLSFAQDKVPMEFEGREGIWFEKDLSIKILEDLDKGKQLEGLVGDLEIKIGLQKDKIDTLLYYKSISDQLESAHTELIKVQDRQLYDLDLEVRKLKASKGKWYNSRTFWFATGFITCSVAVGLSVGLYSRYLND